MTNPIRSCFVSYSLRTDVEPLLTVLRDKGIEVYDSTSTTPGTAPYITAVAELLHRADLVIAVISDDVRDPDTANVYYDLGFAIGAGKRAILIAPANLRLPPLSNYVPTYRTDLKSRSALQFAIDQTLKAAPTRKGSAAAQVTKPLGDAVASYQAALGGIAVHGTSREMQLSALLASAFESAGATIDQETTSAPGGPDGPDILIWAADLESTVGNPVVAEVKYKLTKQTARSTAHRVSRYVANATARWGIVLYADGPRDINFLSKSQFPNILFLDAGQLLERLRIESLARIITELRNRAVHSVSR